MSPRRLKHTTRDHKNATYIPNHITKQTREKRKKRHRLSTKPA